MSLQSDALLTVEEAREGVREGTDLRGGLLESYVNAATEVVHRHLRRKVRSRTFTDEKYNGSGRQMLLLRQWPVTALTAVKWLTNVDPDVWEAQSITRFVTDDPSYGGITDRLYRFPCGVQNVAVTYTAGYTTVPPQIKLAAKLIVRHMLQLPDQGIQRIAAISQGGATTTFRYDDMPPEAVMMLKPFRRTEVL